MTASTTEAGLADVRVALDDPASFATGHPFDQYRWLRAEHPVWFHPEADGPGFWAVTRYADVVAVGRDAATYSSWLGGVMIADAPPEALAASRLMMLYQDPPEHTRYRRLVSRHFTPRAVALWQERIEALAASIVDRVAARGECDLVADVAGEMPSLVVAALMGISDDEGRRLYHLTEIMHSADPGLSVEERLAAIVEMHATASATAARKRQEPGDDLMTALVTADLDGEKLTDDELNWFFLLLVNAGGDTTRNLIAGGVQALLEHPDQLAALRADPDGLLPTAVEELLRWVSPVVHMRRTATADTVLAGQPVAAGDKVVVFYGSANRDERVFTEPDRFDLTRAPNPHVAFGGGGPHFCLGSYFARLETSAILRQIVTRLDGLAPAGPAPRLPSTFVCGPKSFPVTFAAS
ncbi:MAG TPA: cytochrome P450 [Mycobacteriales bacterium]